MTRNIAAEYIRAGSILYIIAFWHLQSYGNPLPWIGQAYVPNYLTIVALALFVFSSGNFIGSNDKKVQDFYWKRFVIVYVPFAAVTLVYMTLDLGGGTSPLLKGILLVGMVYKPAASTLWFANMICLFYLVAPLLKWLRDRQLSYLALCSGITALLCGIDQITGQIDQRLMLYFPVFAAGIFLKPSQIKTRPILMIGAALTAVSILTIHLDAADMQYSYLLAPFALGSAMLVTSFLYSAAESWPRNAVVSLFASSSYFSYLLHRPIYQLVLGVIHPQSPWLVTCELLFIGLPLTIFLAWAFSASYAKLIKKYGNPAVFSGAQP